jgi:UDP-glucuronate 4-epimerase
MRNYLVIDAAGFIGSRITKMLIEQGHAVTDVHTLNGVAEVCMKENRLRKVQALPGFTFQKRIFRSVIEPNRWLLLDLSA